MYLLQVLRLRNERAVLISISARRSALSVKGGKARGCRGSVMGEELRLFKRNADRYVAYQAVSVARLVNF